MPGVVDGTRHLGLTSTHERAEQRPVHAQDDQSTTGSDHLAVRIPTVLSQPDDGTRFISFFYSHVVKEG